MLNYNRPYVIFFALKIMTTGFFSMVPLLAEAEDYFDPSLLETVNHVAPMTDLSAFNKNEQLPGKYRVKIDINNEFFQQQMVRFILGSDGKLTACFTQDDYVAMGIDFHSSLLIKDTRLSNDLCSPMSEKIDGAVAQFDFSDLHLSLSIPQMALLQKVKNDAPESQWDEGITAFTSNYRLNGSLKHQQGEHIFSDSENDAFLDWRNGFNFGAWRVRNYSSWSDQESWNNLSTYVERSIHSLNSELTIGDYSTQQSIFDSLSIRGIQLSTDPSMLPESINGFSPIIHGIAKSNAQVTIRNAGNILYQANVPPGPFALTDIVPVSDGGELDVTIKEADGTEKKFSVPYATVPLLQRAGQLNFGLAMGQYQGDSQSQDLYVVQSNFAYGLPFNLTILGGGQISENYWSISSGIGLNAGFLGGFSFFVIQEKTIPIDGKKSSVGTSINIDYSKLIAISNTTVQVSNKLFHNDYLSFQNAQDREIDDNHTKNQQVININQPVDDTGDSLFLSLNRTGYQLSADRLYQAGLNGSIHSVTYTFSLSETKSAEEPDWDRQIALNISVPLSIFSSSNLDSGSASYMVSQNNDGSTSQQISLSDSLNEDHTLNYSASAGYSNDGNGSTGSINISNKGSKAETSVGYNIDSQQRELTYGVTGGYIIHSGGVTLHQYMENASALVNVPGGKDINVSNTPGIMIDDYGYAVVPNISAYRKDEINLVLPPGGRNDVDIPNISENVIPTKDAIVLVNFKTNIGRKIIVTLKSDNFPIPFGTRVSFNKKLTNFYVADRGLVFVTGMPERGILTAELGNGKTCKSKFSLPKHKLDRVNTIDRVTLLCK